MLQKASSYYKEDHYPQLIGIGASAGGLEALEAFFSNIYHELDFSFVVVQHLSPDYKSMMVKLLSRKTKMKVERITDGVRLEKNCIYLIPPRKNLTVFNSALYLTDQSENRELKLPIDIFFKSLAAEYGHLAVGIVLSGTGSDGTQGIKAIKEAGGMVMVQDPLDAKFDGMPKSAINTNLVDNVLSASDLPLKLIKYFQHPYTQKLNHPTKEYIDDDFENHKLLKVLNRVKLVTGADFASYKPTTIVRRIEKRISINQIKDIDEYINHIYQSEEEVNNLYQELLIGVTQFFRDPKAFVQLKEHIKNLIQSKSENNDFRVWVAACSTGEEAYTIAIIFNDIFEELNISKTVKIFATDLDKKAINIAAQGFYSDSITSIIADNKLNKYFIRHPNGFQVIEKIRKMVVFAKHNVLKDPPFSKMDLVSCRNLLIYFKPHVQQKVISVFNYALINNGLLFLGSSESLGENKVNLEILDQKYKIFRNTGSRKIDLNNFILQNNFRKRSNSMTDKIINQEKKADIFALETTFADILNCKLPPSILLDGDNQITHLFGDLEPYLEHPKGKLGRNLVDFLKQPLLAVCTALLSKVRENKEPIRVESEFYNDKIQIQVECFPAGNNYSNSYVLFSFSKEVIPTKEPAVQKIEVSNEVAEHITFLEKELSKKDDNLQSTIEELETSNEELQATNEELVAANEELQSTNEELQSVNEELHTVNTEHQEKIQELIHLNSDIRNLLYNIDVGTIFLDTEFKLRRFTESATKLFNIMEIDIGRPFSHISINADVRFLFEDVKQVAEKLEVVERKILSQDENWYLVKILPYRDKDYSYDGIIITITEITELIKNQNALQNSESRYNTVLSNLPGIDVYYFDLHMNLIIARGTQMNKMNFDYDYFEGKNLTKTIDDETLKVILPAYTSALKGKPATKEFQYKNEWFKIKTIPVKPDSERITGGIAIIQNITEIKDKTEQLLMENNILENILNLSIRGYLRLSMQGQIIYCNKLFKDRIDYDIKISETRIDDIIDLNQEQLSFDSFDQLESPVILENVKLKHYNHTENNEVTLKLTPFTGHSEHYNEILVTIYYHDTNER